MIYLEKGFFKPMLILTSIILLPLSTGCLCLLLIRFRIDLLIITFALFLSYIIAALGIYKYSKSQKFYLIREEKILTINYPNLPDKGCLKINTSDILKFEYYKLSSFRAWCMLFNCVCPQCVYITYLHNGKECCDFIGYPDLNEIKNLSADIGANVILK